MGLPAWPADRTAASMLLLCSCKTCVAGIMLHVHYALVNVLKDRRPEELPDDVLFPTQT